MRKRIGINRQLYIQNFILVAIPTILVVCISLFLFQNIYDRYAEDYENLYMQNALNQNIDVFDRINNNLIISVNHMTSLDNVKVFFLNDNIIQEGEMFRNFVNTFNSVSQSSMVANDYIDGIAIYSETNHYLYSTDSSNYVDRSDDISWLTEYKKGDRKYRYLTFDNKGERKLAFFAPVTMYGVTTGTIIIYFDYEKLLQCFTLSTFEYFQISNMDNIIVLSSKFENVGKLNDAIDGEKKSNYSGKRYSIKSEESSYSFELIPNTAYSQKVDKFADGIYRILLISVAFIFILVALIAIKVYFPIKKISDYMLKHQDSLEANCPQKYKKEYEFIIGNIQSTLDNNIMLKEQLSDQLKKLNKMHMVALQAQINPHFLYNTLQMIALCAEEKLNSSDNVISNSIMFLSKLMQRSISTRNPLTTLKDELHHLLMYYHLQRELYGDMCSAKIEIPRELDDYVISKMTLQPIFENSVQYGIKPSERKCTVTIRGELAENQLHIYVLDDGIGMEEATLNDLRKRMNREDLAENSNIGLCNINQRIKLIFGQEYGITIDSSFGIGTEVKIILPAKEMKNITGDN